MCVKMMLTARNILCPIDLLQCSSKSVRRAFSGSVNSKLKEETIRIQNWDINYVKVGTGDRYAMFLPGVFGTKWTHGDSLIEGFDREKFTLVAWDPPGYGKSRPPGREFSKDFYEKEADLAHEFMKALGIDKYSLLGFSGGGITGIIQAAKYSDAVNKLVLWSTSSFISPLELDSYAKYLDINMWSQKQLKPLTKIYGEQFVIKYWAKWAALMKEFYDKNDGHICSQYLKYIKCPTFLLYGQKDPLLGVNLHIPYLLKHVKDSRIYVYPDGRHHIHVNYVEDFNRRVREFLLMP